MLPTQRPTYRADIDGLRALAVLPVLLYHAGIPGLSGGYVGVDVFFVISGYLITGIIGREIDEGRFSLWKFYERRARRILPALFAVILFVLAMASWLYLPGDFEGVPPSALAALLFAANVWFFTQTGYFQGGAETMPLLHTWSLGVEEQFYIIFPVVLLVLARASPKLRAPMIAAGFALSFIWAWWAQDAGDGFAFFMLPTRAWELLAGSALALGYIPAVRSRRLAEMGAMLGAGLIIAAVLFYDRSTVFPGIAAIPPVLGAALLIHCAPGTFAGKMLSLRGPVFIGAISYSLYLWHWPLVVFAEYAQDAPLSGWQSAAIVTVSLAAAWVSWRFIEAPFRRSDHMDRKAVFTWSAVGMTALAAASAALVTLGPWDSRFGPRVAALTAAKHDVSPLRAACLTSEMKAPPTACKIGADGPATIMLWGDSHGVELAYALGQKSEEQGKSLLQRTRPSCPPMLGWSEAAEPGCLRFNSAVMAEIEGNASLTDIYLAGFWAGERYNQPGTLALLDSTITRLQDAGKRVTMIAPVPAQPFNVPRRLARGAAFGSADNEPPALTAAAYARQSRWIRARFPAWRARDVRILDPADTLVDESGTVIVADGKPLYFDSHHLSLAGAHKVLAAGAQ